MNDQLESQLSAAFAMKLETLPAETQLRVSGFDYRARATRRNRIVAVIGSSATAVLGGASAVIVVLASGAPIAYAGWTATPSTPTSAALTAATTGCNSASTQGAVLSGQPVLTDSRDAYTAAVFVSGTTTWVCISDGQSE
jgi:hypothetical protein